MGGDDPVQPFEVLADTGLFRFDSLGPVLAEKKFQQGAQVEGDLVLVFDGPGELVLSQQGDQGLELDVDQLVFALLSGLLQQRGPARIGRPGQFGDPLEHGVEVFELVGDPLLFQPQLFGRIDFSLFGGWVFGGRVFGGYVRRRGGLALFSLIRLRLGRPRGGRQNNHQPAGAGCREESSFERHHP